MKEGTPKRVVKKAHVAKEVKKKAIVGPLDKWLLKVGLALNVSVEFVCTHVNVTSVIKVSREAHMGRWRSCSSAQARYF